MKLKAYLVAVILIFGISIGFKLVQTNNNPVRPHEALKIPTEWMDYQRTYPYQTIKPESVKLGMEQAMELHNKASRNVYNWEFAGPKNIGGRITDIAIHPDDMETMYIGAATGGIFKTTDSGTSWDQIFADAPVISIGDLEIDPNNPDVVYAGTGEANSSSYSFLGNGMYKSTNAGSTWTHIGLENSAYIGRVIVDYNNSDRIFVAACGYLFSTGGERGIYRSNDGGSTWENLLFVNDSTSGIDLVQHPENPDILYAAMWERSRGLTYRNSFGDGSGVWMTTDGGDTWTELVSGLPTGNNVGRIGLTIALSNPDVLYAFYDMPGQQVRVYRTNNGGTTWTRTNDGSMDGMNSSFGWYFGQVRVDPVDENIVYALGVELHRTMNGGTSWEVIADYGTYDIHVDHHAMFIDSETGRIFEGNDGGYYYSDDYGDSWSKINNLPITQFYFIEVDDSAPQRLYGGTQDNSTIRTMTGSTYDWHVILGGDGFYCLVDYENNNNIFAESQYGGLYKSENGGYNFDYIAWNMYNDRTNWMAPLAMHPEDPETLYFGTYRIWKTTAGGSGWTAVSGDLTQGGSNYYHSLTTIDISPINPDIVVVGSADSRVHISDDAGGSWVDISDGLPERWITRVATDPFDVNTIYATVSGFRWEEPQPHVYKSTNLGQTWTNISGNLPDLPVNVIMTDPEVEGRLFVGTDAGAFYTENGGQLWKSLMDGLPMAPVISMDLHNPTRKLILSTYGISAYRLNLDELVSVDDNVLSEAGSIKLSAYPNPYSLSGNQTILFEYAGTLTENTDLNIYNISGQLVRNIPIATEKISWDGTNLQGTKVVPGVYIGRVNTDLESGSVKINIID